MNQKNDVDNFDLNKDNNDDDFDLDYKDDDFMSAKTKSLNKFPLKKLLSNEFYLDDIYKNFSKSLKFNSHKCFAPKPTIIQSSKNPTPIIFEKQSNFHNLNIQDDIIKKDAFSEKEISLGNESSFSSDFENENIQSNNKKIIYNDINYNNLNNYNNNNYIISKNLLDISDKKSEDKNESLYENKINSIEDDKDNTNLKLYEHKTITSFPIKNNYNDNYAKGNIKAIRNSLFRAKIKSLKKKCREVEYKIKDKMKIKYGLNIYNNESKKIEYNFEFCKVIPINNNKKEENNNVDKKNDEDNEDMSKFRKTISYNNSKMNIENNKKKEDKGITIYDILLINKNNKINH